MAFGDLFAQDDIVDEVALRLNYPHYFKDPQKLSTAALRAQITEVEAEIQKSRSAIDMFLPYHRRRLRMLRAELVRRDSK